MQLLFTNVTEALMYRTYYNVRGGAVFPLLVQTTSAIVFVSLFMCVAAFCNESMVLFIICDPQEYDF
jgi:hypothetical protein